MNCKLINMKVFLGGTINGSKWRDDVISRLEIDYFNPVVEQWDDEARLNEVREKKSCDYLLFAITPLMVGVFSIAEVVDLSNKVPQKTILCILDEDEGAVWSDCQKKSLIEVKKLVGANGAHVFENLDDVVDFLNKK